MAKKKNNNKLLLILFIAIILISGLTLFSIGDTMLGATILSVDSVNFMGEEEIVVSLVPNGGGEYLTGTITPEDIERFNLGKTTAQDFKIEVQLDDVSCNYDYVDSDRKIGEIFNAQVVEQCLGITCPYDMVDIDDLIQKCIAEGKDNCERMVELNSLPDTGIHTEWCSWMPEESNVAQAGECQFIMNSPQVKLRVHSPYPSQGCDFCVGKECVSYIKANKEQIIADRWASYYTLALSRAESDRRDSNMVCGYITGETTGVGEDNGDWNVQSMGMIPKYDVYDIQTTPMIRYNATIKIALEDGTTYQGSITETDSIASLGELGNVKWTGNLVGNQFCPQPAIDTKLVKDIDTQEIKPISTGAGTFYQGYIDTFMELTRTDADHYTFTLVTPTTITAIDPAVGGDIIYTSYTKMNSFFEEILDEEKTQLTYECGIKDGLYSCQTTQPVVIPMLRLNMKASEIGIQVNEGMPKILSLLSSGDYEENTTDIKLNSNEITEVNIFIKNIGEETDSFDVKMECPFPVSQQSDRISLEAGESSFTRIYASGDGIVQKCNIVATSVSYPENQDTYEFNLIVNPSCDTYGIDDMTMTEFGCYVQPIYPNCNEGEIYLSSLKKCISKTSLESREERDNLLAEVGKTDCHRQCDGNAECVKICLEQGNVKPVCVDLNKMMSLNDYLCDFDKDIYTPTFKEGQVWLEAPVCDYVCEYGKTGDNCDKTPDVKEFNYEATPTQASLIDSSKTCVSCFDGIQNQDEEGIDCGGICEDTFGRDKDCDKLRSPEHCYNHIQDGDEEGRDCGGSCDFDCSESWQPTLEEESFIKRQFEKPIVLYSVLGATLIFLIYLIKRKKGKKK